MDPRYRHPLGGSTEPFDPFVSFLWRRTFWIERTCAGAVNLGWRFRSKVVCAWLQWRRAPRSIRRVWEVGTDMNADGEREVYFVVRGRGVTAVIVEAPT